MAQEPRRWKCDCEGCASAYTEEKFGDGAPGWGRVLGVMKDDQEPYLCPGCLQRVQHRLMKGDI